MYGEKIIEFYEACALDTIKNALSGFKVSYNLDIEVLSYLLGDKGNIKCQEAIWQEGCKWRNSEFDYEWEWT